MRIIYIDEIFVLNLAGDFLLLLALAKLCAIAVKKRRLLLAALLGAAYAALAAIPAAPGFVRSIPVWLAVGALIALIAFGNQRNFLRGFLIFLGVTFCFVGVNFTVKTVHFDFKTLLITLAAAYAVIAGAFKFAAAKKPAAKSATSRLTIAIGAQCVEITVLNDSGNTLRDPLNGSVLPIVNYGKIRQLLPESARAILESAGSVSDKYEALHALATPLAPRLVPYRAIGTDSGLLITLKADALAVDGSPLDSTRFAISPTPINYFGGIL